MAEISVKLSDDLLRFIQQSGENRDALIESLLKQWQQQQEEKALAQACGLVDELELGWESEWQNAAITDWEASGS
jgi:Arc/MetJ-type ribon-helix-helix transcriptional regulator